MSMRIELVRRDREAAGTAALLSGCRKSGGRSQFHSALTTVPPRNVKRAMATMPSRMAGTMYRGVNLIGVSSFIRDFVVDVLQPLAQMQDRVAFAREQRVHADSRLHRDLLEAASFQLMRDEHVALFLR